MNFSDLREIERALYFIPASIERDKWIEIGDALKTTGIAFEIFDDWSSHGDTYNAKTCRQQWKSFNGSHTASTVIYYAKHYGYVADKSVKPDYEAIEKAKADAKRRAEQQKLLQIQLAREAAIKCFNDWQKAIPADNYHPYLIKKHVPAIGLKIDAQGHLLIPVLNAENQLQSLQIINSRGEKLFAKNSITAGGFYQLGYIADESTVIHITEGYATAATIISLTGNAIFIAFSASNLMAIAQFVRQRYPKNPIVLCADNDHLNRDGTPRAREKNTGVIKAKEAAKAIHASLSIPYCHGSDFNDLFIEFGHDECLKQLKPIISPAMLSKPVRHAIALLLQRPNLAKSAADKIEQLDSQELALLKNLLYTSLDYPEIKTNELITMYQGLPEEKIIQTLANKTFPFTEEGMQSEFLSTLETLINHATTKKYLTLLAKEASQGLNSIEKTQLTKTLNKLHQSKASRTLTNSLA